MCKHILGEMPVWERIGKKLKRVGRAIRPWCQSDSEWRRAGGKAGGKVCWIAMQYEEGWTKSEEPHSSQEQTCLDIVPSSVTDWEQPTGGMVLVQMTMNFNVNQLSSLITPALHLPSLAICNAWPPQMLIFLLHWWFYLKEPHPSSFLTMSILTMIEEATDLRRKAALAIQFYSLEIPIKKSIRKSPGSMLSSISESSDHLTNTHFHAIAQDLFSKKYRV